MSDNLSAVIDKYFGVYVLMIEEDLFYTGFIPYQLTQPSVFIGIDSYTEFVRVYDEFFDNVSSIPLFVEFKDYFGVYKKDFINEDCLSSKSGANLNNLNKDLLPYLFVNYTQVKLEKVVDKFRVVYGISLKNYMKDFFLQEGNYVEETIKFGNSKHYLEGFN